MLSQREERTWVDVQRSWAADEEEERVRVDRHDVHLWERPRATPGDVPGAVAAGFWIAVALVIFGAPVAGVAVAVATALCWLLWHRRSSRPGGPAGRPSEVD